MVRVLGVDPGLTRCGIGVVEGTPGRQLRMVDVDVFRTSASLPTAERLLSLQKDIDAWVRRYHPDEIAIERVFADVSRNGRQRYCSARCGNNDAVRRHRRRSVA